MRRMPMLPLASRDTRRDIGCLQMQHCRRGSGLREHPMDGYREAAAEATCTALIFLPRGTGIALPLGLDGIGVRIVSHEDD